MPQSGTFDIPTLLSYPHIAAVDDCPQIIGKYCYIVEGYQAGYSIIFKSHAGTSGVSFGDWSGTHNEACAEQFLSDFVPKCIELMRCIRLPQMQVFISAKGLLVDVQRSLNKFIGPGMLRDLFHNIIETQKIVAIDIANQSKIDQLKSSGNYILKPSKFRYYEMGDNILPLYARI